MESQEKHEIIKRLEDGHISKQTVAVKQGLQVHYYKGTKGLVIKTFNEELLFSTNDKVYVLEEIPIHEKTFINFDFKPTVEKPKKQNIPDAKHPW